MEQEGKEIEIKKMIIVLKKYFWVITVFTILTTSAGLIYNYLSKPTPLYEASSRIIIHESTDLINTLKVVIKEPPILEAVINDLSLNQSVESLSSQIRVESVENSRIVKLTVSHPNPEEAALIANTLANVYKREIATILNFNNVDLFAEAIVKDGQQPINPQTNRIVFISFMFGLIVGIGFVFLLDSLDNRLKTVRDIERLLEAPVLGTVSKINNKSIEKNKMKQTAAQLRGETIGS
ncbi:YveK family protein [Bacillus suaedae]|uniref:Capsular biosynthesis protein n=1 Tax=Halalkalibacter suaedae TaxID=2822140 RepID=A0A940WWB5_9BACI|nr:Wzz/FepE/Etk N-terminal domain-containing protein [Bacillus suaedae]MBP3951528.1 capsular biosynthesis protein [Bacillus suaedae]